MLFARIQEAGGALIVTPLVRELGADAARELRENVGERARGRSLVVVSLVDVEAIECSALAGLVAVLKQMAPGGELRLASARGLVRALLSATRVDEVFPLFDDAAAALAP